MLRARRFMPALFSLFLLGSALLHAGCGTLHSRTSKTPHDGELYPATKQTSDWIADPDIPILGRSVMLVDYPFSIVSDTLLLPFDYFGN